MSIVREVRTKTNTLRDWRVLCIPLCFISLSLPAQEPESGLPDGWEKVLFEGETDYQHNGECWEAKAEKSASALVLRRTVSLNDTPRVEWQWKAQQAPQWPQTDEQSKAGDDFQARVYVVKEGLFPWEARAINYVWSRQYPIDSFWLNPFASQAVMVVVQSEGEVGQWHAFSRDVKADFKRYHGMDVDHVDAIAVMTDGDNTASQVSSCYQLPAFAQSS